jgi:hypothetical protein
MSSANTGAQARRVVRADASNDLVDMDVDASPW